MNRLHHLKQTLPKNIKDNIGYENVEFVVLNYNSKDELDIWIKSEMSKFLELGILKYYKTIEPESFHMSHSKNVVAKLASGEIICNVDADNYIGLGFAEYINSAYKTDDNIFIAVDRSIAQRDCYGRICLLKKDFLTLRGYDENMKGYGFEDFDFWNRLELLGRKAHYIKNKSFLKALTHTDSERLENESNSVGVEKIYVRYITHAVSELMYLFKDGTFSMGKMVINKLYNSESINNLFDEYRNFRFRNRLYNNSWQFGKWSIRSQVVELRVNLKLKALFDVNGEILLPRNPEIGEFHEIVDKYDIEDTLMFYSQINNRIIMKRNKAEKVIEVNKVGFGEIILE